MGRKGREQRELERSKGRQWPSEPELEAENVGFPLTHITPGAPLFVRKAPFLALKTLHSHPGAHAFLPMAQSKQVAVIVARRGQRQEERQLGAGQ